MTLDLGALVGFSPADTARLKALKPYMADRQEDVINAFYERILSFPAFGEMIKKTCERDNIDVGQLVAHINEVQFRHWQRFFDGVPNQAFQDSAHKIGTAHEKCLLSSDLYVASSAIILERFIAIALDHHLGNSNQVESAKASLAALIHMFFLDLSHAIKAYDRAAAHTAFREISEPLLNAFEDEVTRELASMSAAARELNETIKNIVQLNKDNVQRCRDTMSSIEALTGRLGELGQTTRRIEGFVSVISDVARKTKLLALNAAIEAARSGEYGRGFSVVANEVKALASEAEGATKQITQQAGEIQSLIEKAVAQVAGSQHLVEAIDQGVTTESQAIDLQNTAVGEISTNLAAVTEGARGLRTRFRTFDAA